MAEGNVERAQRYRLFGFLGGLVGGGLLAFGLFRLACSMMCAEATHVSETQSASDDEPVSHAESTDPTPPTAPAPQCTASASDRSILLLATGGSSYERVDLDCAAGTTEYAHATPALAEGYARGAWWAVARNAAIVRIRANDGGRFVYHSLALDGTSHLLFTVEPDDPLAGDCSWVEAADSIACIHREGPAGRTHLVIAMRSLAEGASTHTIRWARTLLGTGPAVVMPDGESVSYAEPCERRYPNDACLFRANLHGANATRLAAIDADADVCSLVPSRTGDLAVTSVASMAYHDVDAPPPDPESDTDDDVADDTEREAEAEAEAEEAAAEDRARARWVGWEGAQVFPPCDTLWFVSAPPHSVSHYLAHSWGGGEHHGPAPSFGSVTFSPDGLEVASLSDENEYCGHQGPCISHLERRVVARAGPQGAPAERVDHSYFGLTMLDQLVWPR